MARAEKVVADDIETPEPESTVRDDLESARDEVNARQETETQGNEAAGESTQTAADRDPSGRFTKRASTETPEAGVQRGAQENTQTQGAEAGVETPSTQLAPQGWTSAGKAMWPTLPEAARSEIMRREQDMHRKISAQDEERTVARQFNEITQAHQEVVTKTGLHPLRLYQDFLGYAKTLGNGSVQDKAALLRQIAMNNGIDPRALAGLMPPPGQQNSQQPQPGAPPQLTSLPPEVLDTVKGWKEFQQRQQTEARQADESAQQKVLEEIVAFRSKPESRFFDAVKDQMIGLINSGSAGTLEEAYESACWARPDIRQILQTEAAQAATAAKSRQAKASQARFKSGSVRGSVGASTESAAGNRSLREELQANFAEARSRI